MEKTANLIEKFIEFKMLGLHFDRIADIALTEKEDLQPANIKRHTLEGDIEVNNVSFAYSDATPNVLDNLSLKIKAGESVAITGPSGCGKSTLLKLLLGLNKAKSGEVLIDDTLKELEAELEGSFIRIHRNALISKSNLLGMEQISGGQYLVSLRGTGNKLIVSRRHVAGLRRLMQQM